MSRRWIERSRRLSTLSMSAVPRGDRGKGGQVQRGLRRALESARAGATELSTVGIPRADGGQVAGGSEPPGETLPRRADVPQPRRADLPPVADVPPAGARQATARARRVVSLGRQTSKKRKKCPERGSRGRFCNTPQR